MKAEIAVPTQDSNLSIQSTQTWDAARAYAKLRYTMTAQSLPIQELREPLLSALGRRRRVRFTSRYDALTSRTGVTRGAAGLPEPRERSAGGARRRRTAFVDRFPN